MTTSNLTKTSLGTISLESGRGLPYHNDNNGTLYSDSDLGNLYSFRNNTWVSNTDTYMVSFIQAAAFNPADNTTYYQSQMAASTVDSTSGFGFLVPYNSYLIAASLNNNFVAGTSGIFITGGCRNSTLGTDIVTLFTDIDLSTAGNNNGYHVSGVTQFISGGTRISVFYKCPTWAANPTSWRPGMIFTLIRA